MKKLVLVCLMAVMGLGVCAAQKASGAKKGTTTVVFATDIDCDHCVTKIMNNVPSLGKGVKDVQADVQTKELTVVFDAARNDIEHIVKGLASLKVEAKPVRVDGKAVACPTVQ